MHITAEYECTVSTAAHFWPACVETKLLRHACRNAKASKGITSASLDRSTDDSGSNSNGSSNGAPQLIGDRERQALTAVADPKLSVAEKLQRADEMTQQGKHCLQTT